MPELIVRAATTLVDLRRCFPVMRELRPALTEESFREQVMRQAAQGYRLVYLEQGGKPAACAGYRILENLAWGRFLYVDDLVTVPAARSQGLGDRLFQWLLAEARAEGCGQLHLDSGVQRFEAHRFYLRQRMHITSHHFAIPVPAEPQPGDRPRR